MRDTTAADDSAAPPEETELTARLCVEILTYLREENPPIGHRLTERALAEQLRVSRSPVRNALRQLHRDGFIERTASGRYLVARSGAGITTAHIDPPEDEVYLRIAADRLDGLLPDRINKSTLLKRYDLTRTQLDLLLLRISNEGWIAPLPGYGWTFLPVLTSLESYRSSYRFRLLIEPAGILEPTFRVDREAIERRRAEQRQLVEDGLTSVSGAQLFDLNSRFHETLAECTNNDFFVEGLARVNRLRRLIEYRQALVPERAVVRCREHVELADLLLAGDLTAASAFLHRHLTTVGVEKSGPDTPPEGTG
ncbi:FCD domain-containing protein [Streptomyces sp. 150FB]|uniref:FCD domain-containing protein n=1 Tax=Streptomyces sp. 150FB TaxID=1576605 RepID=UPI000A9A1C8D|nr:FCD domain-containing protein [Streptomyces sp. 150FB]